MALSLECCFLLFGNNGDVSLVPLQDIFMFEQILVVKTNHSCYGSAVFGLDFVGWMNENMTKQNVILIIYIMRESPRVNWLATMEGEYWVFPICIFLYSHRSWIFNQDKGVKMFLHFLISLLCPSLGAEGFPRNFFF